MILAIFRKFLVLFFCALTAVFGQSVDNVATIELGPANFPIERPFTISVILPNSETRPVVNFPDIAGFSKRGTSVSITAAETAGKTVTNQVITQSYQARAPGRFRLPPFTLLINGETVQSAGAVLIVRPSATGPNSTTVTVAAAGAAFLQLRPSRSVIYAGEDVGLTLSFFVADNYPFELNFTALNQQLQTIVKQIRPASAWEENLNITELKPIPVQIGGKKFREFRLYQAVFFPLAARTVQIAPVSLRLLRSPVIGPPTAQPESVVFTTKPVQIVVRPLPVHPLRGRVPVGTFQLDETIDQQQLAAGQSTRYTFSIRGEGNIATLPAPVVLNEATDVDIFPPNEQQTINRSGNQITGQKSFTYFIVPHQNGTVLLANRLQWVYFDPQMARYDTLRPQLVLRVGGTGPATLRATQSVSTVVGVQEGGADVSPAGRSLYTGIEAMDSTHQPVNIPVLVRAIANVLIVVMLLGTVFILFKK